MSTSLGISACKGLTAVRESLLMGDGKQPRNRKERSAGGSGIDCRLLIVGKGRGRERQGEKSPVLRGHKKSSKCLNWGAKQLATAVQTFGIAPRRECKFVSRAVTRSGLWAGQITIVKDDGLD